MKKVILTEEEKKSILKMHNSITEGVEVNGRDTLINNDGTVSISDKNGNKQKIRMSLDTPFMETNINVVNIKKTNGGYNITGKSGRTEFVDDQKIGKIISFVDTNSPSEIDSNSYTTPNLLLKKL